MYKFHFHETILVGRTNTKGVGHGGSTSCRCCSCSCSCRWLVFGGGKLSICTNMHEQWNSGFFVLFLFSICKKRKKKKEFSIFPVCLFNIADRKNALNSNKEIFINNNDNNNNKSVEFESHSCYKGLCVYTYIYYFISHLRRYCPPTLPLIHFVFFFHQLPLRIKVNFSFLSYC